MAAPTDPRDRPRPLSEGSEPLPILARPVTARLQRCFAALADRASRIGAAAVRRWRLLGWKGKATVISGAYVAASLLVVAFVWLGDRPNGGTTSQQAAESPSAISSKPAQPVGAAKAPPPQAKASKRRKRHKPRDEESPPTGWVKITNRKAAHTIQAAGCRIEPVGDSYKVRCRESGEYMALAKWAETKDDIGPRFRLLHWVPDSSDVSLRWKFRSLGNGFWSIANCQTGQCLEVRQPNRPQVVRESPFRAGDLTQQWRLETLPLPSIADDNKNPAQPNGATQSAAQMPAQSPSAASAGPSPPETPRMPTAAAGKLSLVFWGFGAAALLATAWLLQKKPSLRLQAAKALSSVHPALRALANRCAHGWSVVRSRLRSKLRAGPGGPPCSPPPLPQGTERPPVPVRAPAKTLLQQRLVALLNGTGRAASVLVRGWGALGPPPRLLLLGGAFAAVALVALVITAMVNSPAEYPRHVATPKAAQSIVRPPSSPGTLPSPITSPQPPGAPEQGDAAQLVARVDPAVVTIRVTVAGDAGREGSGFVVDESGLVITNYHVVEKAMWAHVIFQDKKESKVDGFLACAPGKDLALLKIDPAGRKLPMLRIAGAAPAKGEKVYAFGAPLGFSGSVSDGLVAAVRHADDMREILGDELYVRLLEYDMDTDWIQTTAPISHGNSGGPLVNAQGEVVGVNTLAPPVGQNLNFAVSATHVRHLLRGPPSIPRPLSELPPRRPP